MQHGEHGRRHGLRLPVCDDYTARGLFPFTGKIHSVTFDFPDMEPMTGHERLKLASQMD